MVFQNLENISGLTVYGITHPQNKSMIEKFLSVNTGASHFFRNVCYCVRFVKFYKRHDDLCYFCMIQQKNIRNTGLRQKSRLNIGWLTFFKSSFIM